MTEAKLPRTVGLILLAVVLLSLLARLAFANRASHDVVFECKRQVSSATKSLILAKQDRSDVYKLVHCAQARTYLDCALRAMHTNELARHTSVDVFKLSQAIDVEYDSALARVDGRPSKAQSALSAATSDASLATLHE